MENRFTFNTFNKYSQNGITQALLSCNSANYEPIIICVGTDLVIGDSLGPLVGTLLKTKCKNNYVYGTLDFPITAKEISCVKKHLKKLHPNGAIIVIDAAVGDINDVGLIRVLNNGLMPGLGVNKKLGKLGDISILGIVAQKTKKNEHLFNFTRLNFIYKMAEIISNGIVEYINLYNTNTDKDNVI